MAFYTNVKQYGNNILYRGIKNGKQFQVKVPYNPSLFVPIAEDSPYKTLYGENLKEIKFTDINKAKAFVKQYEGVENFKIYGNTKYEYCFISDLFPSEIEWDINNVRIAIFDIEVNSDPDLGGFASPQDPFQPITAIALKFSGEDKFYQFCYCDYDPPDDVIYIKCKDEGTLLKKFIEIWSINYPEIVSGWNSNTFDLVYLINRCNRILGESETKKLSPWGIIHDRKTRVYNSRFSRYEDEVSYTLLGIASLDYLDLYKKYQPGGNSQESYKLDFICQEEIGENKVEYEGSLHKLYTEDKQTFLTYNTQDVRLVDNLDKKCKLFELALTLAYYTKTNYEDIYHQTRLGDALCYNKLKSKGIQVHNGVKYEYKDFKGGFVKPTITGLFEWIATIDASSLYPSCIRSYGISPETLVEPKDYTDNMKNIIASGVSVEALLEKKIDLSTLKNDNVCLTPNGQFFRTDIKGFIPEIVAELFNKRKVYKKKMLGYQKQYENEDGDKEELKNLIAKYNSLQTATKLVANSLFGSSGNKFFRFYDPRIAEAITLSGQLTNRWIIKNINQYFNAILKQDKDYVLAGDTDSLIITLKDVIDTVLTGDNSPEKIIKGVSKIVDKKIQPNVDEFCKEIMDYCNVTEYSISYKLEKICSSGVFVSKKHYALNVYSNEGVIYAKPKVKVTGLEIVKSSTPAIVKKVLKEGVSVILNSTQQELQEIVSRFKKEFQGLSIEQIAFPRGVQGIHKYSSSTDIYKKGTPIHTRAAIMYNKLLRDQGLDKEYEYIKDGDKIKFCYLKLPNTLQQNVIGFPEKLPKEFDLNRFVDYNFMFEKSFLEPLKSITDVIGWEVEKRNSFADLY